MTDQTELLNAMNALLAKTGAQTTPPASGWAQPQPTGAMVQGVGVPVKIGRGRGRGTLKIMLFLPAECASNPTALNAALDQLEAAGIPLDVWEPKDSGWGGGGSSFGGSRGWRR